MEIKELEEEKKTLKTEIAETKRNGEKPDIRTIVRLSDIERKIEMLHDVRRDLKRQTARDESYGIESDDLLIARHIFKAIVGFSLFALILSLLILAFF